MSDNSGRSSTVRILAIIVIVAGVVFIGAGIGSWAAVTAQLSAENITVAEDAGRFAGQPVDGPLTAYEQANVINKHALNATGGKTYAELDQDDPTRQVAMTASFLRASLFTSVLAYGVAAMSGGLGIVLILIGTALLNLVKPPGGKGEVAV
ncbi:MAG: aromatic ring-opening dioxygenase LigA [Actinomycetia bacterium]|nr:aromatic ring-opening dioxygenase LigA [Actinomycetes bacterium]